MSRTENKFVDTLLVILNWIMMKKMNIKYRILIFLAFSVLSSVHTQAQNMVGKWKTIDDVTGKTRSVVELYEKDNLYYGKIISLFREPGEDPNPLCDACPKDDSRYMRPVIGMEIISSMKKTNNGELIDGKILDPESGNIYGCKIWLENGELKVRGYLYFLYRTQTWLPFTGE